MQNERLINIITRTLIWLSLAMFLFSWALNLSLRITGGTIGIACLISLSYIFHKERFKKENMKNSISVLKNAYNELDNQAKLMAQTDLELNKTQEELDKKITGLYTLHEWGNKTSQKLSINELLNSLDSNFVSELGFKKALIIIVDEEKKELQLKKSVNYSQQQISTIEKQIEKENKLFTKLLSKANTILVNTINEKDPVQKKLSEICNLNSFVIAPILQQDIATGIVIMGNESPYNRVTEGDSELVSILASQIGISIQNSALYEQLWQSHQDLEKSVKQRTKELAEANKELKQLNKTKSDFVSSVTHELRTPLTSIKGFSSILIEGRLGKVPPKQLERLKKIRKHSTNLARLINNLLDISRIESGRIEMQKEEIPIKNAFRNVMEIIQPQADAKDIKVNNNFIPPDLTIWADETHINRVFTNLLGNAVKFTPQNGQIKVTAEKKGDFSEISVSDNGPGIPEKDLDNIFEEFYRSENEINAKEKGSGLGLSLVKRIIEAHDGKIWVENQLNKGTSFTFKLPNKQKESKPEDIYKEN